MLTRFFSYYLPHKRLFFLDFGSAVLAGLLELAFPLAVKSFIDTLLPSQNWGLIASVATLLLLAYCLNTALTAIVSYWGHALGIHIETDMRREAFAHINKLSFSYFDNQKTGKLITNITKDLDDVGEIAHHGPEDLFVAVMTFIGAFALMFTVHWKLALAVTVIVPLLTWIVAKFGAKLGSSWRELFGQIGEFNNRVGETVGGIRVVKAFGNEAHERARFETNNQGYLKTKLAAYRYMTTSTAMTYFSTRFLQLLVMIAGAYFVTVGEMTHGGFIGFLLLVGVFFRPIDQITNVLENYPRGITGFVRFTELLDTEPSIKDHPNAKEAGQLLGNIKFNNVSFAYGTSAKIFQDLNLEITAGETVAFVGPSGSGKTTICSLVPRFYEVEAGSITIDGTDIKKMTQHSLRSQIGIVAQDVFLFAGTIRDNIAYGKLDATDNEIWQAVERAALAEFINSLPDKLDTIVGERGVKLSGGQKQRLSIARIFLKNPPILILDEATSALDTATEMAIQKSLAELSTGRTTLVVAHRLGTVRNADRIVVVTPDGIVEQGSHQELIANDGVYAELHRAQSG